MIKIFHFLFFSILESISDENLPCQVLFQYSSGKSDYFNVVFRLRLSAIAPFKNGQVQSKELGLATRDWKWRHMCTPTWLIVYAIWRTEKYPCFFWVNSYKMPPRRCVLQHCDRVSTPISLPRKLQVLLFMCWSGDIVLLHRNYIGCIIESKKYYMYNLRYK